MPKNLAWFPSAAIAAQLASTLAGTLASTLAVALAVARPGMAGTIEVAPIVVEMPAAQMSTLLTVSNRGGAAATLQVRAFAWSQSPTSDTLTPTRALLVSPPIFEVPPGGSQMVRLVIREPATGTVTGYRLLLDELPSPGSSSMVRLALRISVPVFVQPSFGTAADLSWRVVLAGPNQAEIVARNRGTAPERVSSVGLSLGSGGLLKATGLVDPWVLPGSERRWSVSLPHTALAGRPEPRLLAVLRSGPIDVPALSTPAP